MSTQNEVKVWDLFVRCFHWSLVVLFVVSYLTGDEETDIHFWSGYAIATLVLVRVIWGLIGSEHARFSDFVYSPAVIKAYARDVMAGSAKRYIGHNPLGGLMVVALLLSLTFTTLSGMVLLGVDEGEGPFASLKTAELSVPNVSFIATAYADDDDDDHRSDHKASKKGGEEEEEDGLLEEVHEFFVNFTLLLVLLHIGGVVLESRRHKENLARAMVHGKKRV